MTLREQAAQLLISNGWTQGSRHRYGTDRPNGHSIVGAINACSTSNAFDSSPASRTLIAAIEQGHGDEDLGTWNDAEGRTFEEVIAALQEPNQQLKIEQGVIDAGTKVNDCDV